MLPLTLLNPYVKFTCWLVMPLLPRKYIYYCIDFYQKILKLFYSFVTNLTANGNLVPCNFTRANVSFKRPYEIFEFLILKLYGTNRFTLFLIMLLVNTLFVLVPMVLSMINMPTLVSLPMLVTVLFSLMVKLPLPLPLPLPQPLPQLLKYCRFLSISLSVQQCISFF